MVKGILGSTVLVLLLGTLFSCASAPSMSGSKEAPAAFSEAAYKQGFARDTENRMIQYTVTVRLSVADTEETKQKLQEQTKAYNGYIITESETYVSARIPVETMDAFLGEAKQLGKVEDERKTGTDITDRYQEDTLRLESLKTVRDRYTALLAKAATVTEILGIEKELERVNIEIEVLERQKQNAEMSVAYSNITIRFEKKATPGPLGWVFYGLYRGIKWLFVWKD
ncbi:hypothetical protein FACS189468_9380 [Spirochaetia bacterium]|nr:hypothetical protein FACS189468_9380 [Spirochaetia bacterium]